MSIQFSELKRAVDKIAPERLAEPWDNTGVQILINKPISKILICLDITSSVIEEAINRKADFIVSHHPLIFKELKTIDNNDVTGNLIVRLISAGISVYSSHTSFDAAEKGNNFYLASLLSLENLEKLKDNDGNELNIGISGELKFALMPSEIRRYIEERLLLPEGELRIAGNAQSPIKKIAICSGAGGDLIQTALSNGCGLLLTGDVRHHQALESQETGILIADGGHYGTEKFFTDNFSTQLREIIGDKVSILDSKVNTNPFIE